MESQEDAQGSEASAGGPSVATSDPKGRPPRRRWLIVAAVVVAVAVLASVIALLGPFRPRPSALATPTALPTAALTFSAATALPTATPTAPASTPTPIAVSPFAPVGEPVEANGVIYITTQNGYLYALSAADGHQLWRFHSANTQITGAPTVVNGVVYFGGANSCQTSSSAPPYVYAVDASTGAQLWRIGSICGVGKPFVVTGVIYVGSYENWVAAYRASDGAQLWSRSLGGGCPTLAIASDGISLFVNQGGCGNVVALRVADGSTAWQQRGSGGGAPALANGVLYVGNSALRASDGTVLRTFPVGGEDVVASGVVYIESSQSLSAWDTTTGAQMWQQNQQGSASIFSAGNGEVLAVQGQLGPNQPQTLYAYRASDGTQLWSALSYLVVAQFDPVPTSLGTTVYVGTLDGAVVALNAADGAQVWRAALA